MPARSAKAHKPAPAASPVSLPAWFRPVLLAFAGIFLIGLFSTEIADTDFWWHLRAGEFIVQHHALPVPDPFAYTTVMGHPQYSGEWTTRHFNLTHEWLAQSIFYLVYRATGFPGVVIFRAILLMLFCAIAGLVAYRRCGGFYRGIAAAMATASVATQFTSDRPFLFTFLFLAITVALLEYRRALWLLPPLFLVWGNCHGGFVMGWAVLVAYCGEAVYRFWRKAPAEGDQRLLGIAALSVLASGINPNGFRVLEVLSYYQRSFMTSKLEEWGRPQFWPPKMFSILLALSAAVLAWAHRRVRPVDWLLFAAFAGACFTAERNVIWIAFLGPILLATYLPWKRIVQPIVEVAAGVLLLSAFATGIAHGSFFQLRTASWKFPAGAADFLLQHHVTQRMFNTYEYGGYLMWRLWPQERVFIDGRALNESVFADYVRMLYNHDASGGMSATELLDHYGIQVIVMNGFEYVSGALYNLAPALADPKQTEWALVYQDAQAVVFMRHPPPGVEPLNSLQVFDHLEADCGTHIQHDPRYPRCARSLAQAFTRIGEFQRARRWLGIYLEHVHEADPEASDAYRKLLSSGQ
ncbi:MAG TPA: hypothetical protein VG675_16835 [Bryobacteraceae bacterium]|nr:hypothetical protein [Bryobacteraceae bacterium]